MAHGHLGRWLTTFFEDEVHLLLHTLCLVKWLTTFFEDESHLLLHTLCVVFVALCPPRGSPCPVSLFPLLPSLALALCLSHVLCPACTHVYETVKFTKAVSQPSKKRTFEFFFGVLCKRERKRARERERKGERERKRERERARETDRQTDI